MRNRSVLSLVAGAVAAVFPFIARGEAADSLAEVVVTATRTPKSLKDVPVLTRLITSAEIKKTDAGNIRDLLTEELPGLEFGYAMSQETSLNMGGFGGSAVLFLVDGERLAGETMDNIDYSRLNLEDVGRVEIVKGAASALYGANAVGGVVNLITKESSEPWHVNLGTRYRAQGNEWRTGGKLGFNSGRFNSGTSVQYSDVQTVALTDAFDSKSKIKSIYGGATVNVKERLVYTISETLRLIGRGGFYRRSSLRETYTDRYTDGNVGFKMVWNGLELSYGYDQYEKARFVNSVNTHDHDYTNRQHTIHALYNRAIGKMAFTIGGDYTHDYLKSYQFAGNGVHNQSTADVFVQADYSPLSVLNIVASVRDDWFSESRLNAVTSRLALMLKLSPLTLRASYAGGFRAPTLKEMYMDFDMAGISMIYGNPNLKPERSHNVNLAAERNGQLLHGAYSISVSGYYNYYDNRITTTDIDLTGPNEDGAVYFNEKGVKVAALDVTARYRLAAGIGVSAAYNFMHVTGTSIDSQFSQPRPHSATWRLDYEKRFNRYYRLYAAVSGRYLGKPVSRYETDGAYSILKLTVQQSIWRGINIDFAIDNLLNYRPKIYYWNSAPTTGTTWSLGVSLNINELYGK